MYPAYIHTQTTARNIDHAAIKTYQIPSLILMEHAALKSAEIIEQITNTNQSICIGGNKMYQRNDGREDNAPIRSAESVLARHESGQHMLFGKRQTASWRNERRSDTDAPDGY